MFDISRMDLMWVSFVSIGFMALAAVLIYLARFVITIRFVSILVSLIAWVLLILAFLLMILVIGGSTHA
ncbi:hypothetical protein JEOAER750_01156 [Jeotgalicoccus aerolatus]|jgi:hypothetical protein|uniref:Glucan phosphoethanolaminetransferase (Alkaline phosphatase superfamily) n=1 Tax=Jeotgalicoccus aerolatus TaxID=709510 RepID=A0A1G8UWW2_9STAP|nr:DUF2768 family protein [Jeotgalicoccus aerolatus]MBP1951784.1 glucan phosphoethanolaminetransferase (alkaline phosphatase superfamily) [Jeotgalicoccus aerolatus]CAD2075230.1 hypothetical protein JEOAER750_01156 [Jeotgalicoccus aerolatus]SDJ58356.1 Protein of unknown function [Jeotgalicoccus aerolatus]GGD94812.1 hypothetical protein GCM10007273_03930 [Jeotgalicoccus aerolatus]HJG32145.1 DUF2768 domain-containing protein [Jeotgalicoccus aerolatus]